MTNSCFTKGIDAMLATFPNMSAPPESQRVWYKLLKELTDDEFNGSIENICTTVVNYYSTTNFVALVRNNIPKQPRQRPYGLYENEKPITLTEIMREL